MLSSVSLCASVATELRANSVLENQIRRQNGPGGAPLVKLSHWRPCPTHLTLLVALDQAELLFDPLRLKLCAFLGLVRID